MKNFILSKIKNFRYEHKFFLKDISVEEIENILKLHPAMFREIYHKRSVNNIYMDSYNLQHFFDNVYGVSKRLKVRIRWYGNLFGFIKNPNLELKVKHNFHIGKLIHLLHSFALDNNFSAEVIHSTLKKSDIAEPLKLYLAELYCSLLNHYDRKYFLSSDGNYRITLDTNITFYKLNMYTNNFLHKITNFNNVVMELKYNKPYDEFAENITRHLPFRMTKNSKYVNGIFSLETC